MHAGRALQESRDITAIIYPLNILSFVDENNPQIVKNFTSELFNTQVKALKYYGHIFTYRNFMLALLLQHAKALKGLAGQASMSTVALLQAEGVLFIS